MAVFGSDGVHILIHPTCLFIYDIVRKPVPFRRLERMILQGKGRNGSVLALSYIVCGISQIGGGLFQG
jgi:hypothetical protein